jgi:hypothetical protein
MYYLVGLLWSCFMVSGYVKDSHEAVYVFSCNLVVCMPEAGLHFIDAIGISWIVCLKLVYLLAHRRWAFTITCCPSSSSSVNTARFVTARAIDLKLCTYVPRGHMIYQTKFRSDLILGLATRGPKLKTQKVLLLLNKWLNHPQIFIRGISD